MFPDSGESGGCGQRSHCRVTRRSDVVVGLELEASVDLWVPSAPSFLRRGMDIKPAAGEMARPLLNAKASMRPKSIMAVH